MIEKPVKKRLDILVFEKGLAESRAKAQAMILAGQIEVPSINHPKSGMEIDQNTPLIVKSRNPYVSRGGLKLESAVNHFKVSVDKMICMDIGASTGGFTDFMLQHGASKVYALDVGHNQLHEKLQKDPRVISMEGVNFRYFSTESLKEQVEFVTIDVSFISLEKILPNTYNFLRKGGSVLAMIKPQFEADMKDIKKGVVRDEKARAKAIEKIISFSKTLGFICEGGKDSSIKGPKGNLEHFILLRKG